MMRGSMLGNEVVIRSLAGISYTGTVLAIREDSGLGELFVLGSGVDAAYQRFVHVVDRAKQIRPATVRSEAEGTP
jgi:hypothetical protein